MTPQNINLYSQPRYPFDRVTKNTEKKTKDESKLDQTEIGAHRILFRARTVFPFDLFPDEIVIDENKVDLVYGVFFWSRQVVSVSINDLNGAISMTNIFFGSLELEVRGYDRNPIPIKYLWNKDANRARRIVNGLVACVKQGVDTSNLNLKSAKDKIEDIGSAREAY